MIAPDKHTEIKTSLLYIAGLILRELSKGGIMNYDDLKKSVSKNAGSNMGDSFEYAVSFLYLIGRIMYNPSLDSFTLTA